MKIKWVYITLSIVLIILVLFSVTIKSEKVQSKILSINVEGIELFTNITNIFQNIDNFILTYQENNILKQESEKNSEEIANLKNYIIELSKINDEYKEEMSIEKIPQTTSTYADVIYRSNASWNDYATINKGSTSSIATGDVVTNNGYLVGEITEVTETTAKVEFFTTPTNIGETGVSITTTASEVPCVIKSYDPYKNELVITPLADPSGTKINDQVYTNGMDNQYPDGIKIGEISEIIIDDKTGTMEIIVTPGASFHNFEVVTVLKWDI